MNKTPNANRPHILIMGRPNAGKSTLFNKLINQELAIVSNIEGTTTDPVKKAMELIPYGPVLFVDTAGIGEIGTLGEMRNAKSIEILSSANLILYVAESKDILNADDISNIKKEISSFKRNLKLENVPIIPIISKTGLINLSEFEIRSQIPDVCIFSNDSESDIEKIRSTIIDKLSGDNIDAERSLLAGILPEGSRLLLVVPVDSEAPKGRLILPQAQTIRDALDNGMIPTMVRDSELQYYLKSDNKIDLIITDSQVYSFVKQLVIDLNLKIKITTFSILFARQKGDLDKLIEGIDAIKKLKDGDKVLIAEACTHNISHEDIGRFKIPKLIEKISGCKPDFKFMVGNDFMNESDIKLIVHCGGCMLNRKSMLSRIAKAEQLGIPITNYGLIFAYIKDSEILQFKL